MERIKGVFAKAIHANRFNSLKLAYEHQIAILKETLTFVNGFDIIELRKENAKLKGYYAAECKRNERMKLVNESLREEIYKLKNIIEIRK